MTAAQLSLSISVRMRRTWPAWKAVAVTLARWGIPADLLMWISMQAMPLLVEIRFAP